jgi:hypothetical protein
MPGQHLFVLIPAIVREVTPGDIEPRPFGSFSRFGHPRVAPDIEIEPTHFHAAPSAFRRPRLVAGPPDVDLRPAHWSNVSAFGSPTLAVAGPDVNLRPAHWSSESTFGSPTISTAPADVNLRPSHWSSASTFGSPVVELTGDDDDDYGPIGIAPIGTEPGF